jgi:hypothetical protein
MIVWESVFLKDLKRREDLCKTGLILEEDKELKMLNQLTESITRRWRRTSYCANLSHTNAHEAVSMTDMELLHRTSFSHG